jgi:hypothetical protein
MLDSVSSIAGFAEGEDGPRQLISPSPAVVLTTPENRVSLDVIYDTDPRDETLTGLGLRMHFDSRQLTFDQLDNLFQPGFIQQQVQTDTSDFDDDPDTDTFLLTLWADIAGNWSGEGTQPQRLFSANFDSTSAFDATTVNFTASSTPLGFGFMATSAEVTQLPAISIGDVSNVEGDSGPTTFTFPLTLSRPVPANVTVAFQTEDGSATTSDVDYETANGVAEFVAGETAASIAVSVNGDTRPESDESFGVVLANPSGASIARERAMATIVNDDRAQIVLSSPDELSVTPDSTFSFDVNYRADPVDETLTGLGLRTHFDSSQLSFNSLDNLLPTSFVQQQVLDDTDDFDSNPNTDQFILTLWADAAGLWPGEGTLPQTLFSPNFTARPSFSGTTVNFTSSSTAQGFQFQAQPVQLNAQSIPSISVGDVMMVEGNTGTQVFAFPLTLSTPSAQEVTVSFDTADDTATFADGDYQQASGTATFADGVTSQTIEVVVNGDTQVESDESFVVTLSNPDGASINVGQATGVIENDDSGRQIITTNPIDLVADPGGAIQFAVMYGTQPTDETLTGLGLRMHFDSNQLTFDRLDDVLQDSLVQQQSLDDSSDFDNDPNTDTFVLVLWADASARWPGNGTQPATLFAPNFVASDSFAGTTVRFSASSTAQGFELDAAPVAIQPSTLPRISIGDVTLAEGTNGVTSFQFPVTLSSASANEVTAQFQTSDGTATLSDGDYQPASGIVTFLEGQTAQSLEVVVDADSRIEADETFVVELSSPSGATISDNQATGTIQNDDIPDGPGDVSGLVYFDVNDNGLRDANEPGLPGVQISLSGTDSQSNTVSMTALTGDDGSYVFFGVPDGTYAVNQRQPAAFSDGRETTAPQPITTENNQYSNVIITTDDPVAAFNFGESGLRPEFISKQLYLASHEQPHVVMRRLIARGEELAGDAAFADLVRSGATGTSTGQEGAGSPEGEGIKPQTELNPRIVDLLFAG